MRKFCFLVLFSLGLICYLAELADTTENVDDTPYCLHFTWLGPLYDETSTVNITCDDYAGTPCIEPFIVTTDGSEPNITYMWENYNHSTIGCPLRSGYACIKYTYTFNNALMNASYFCGKMIQDTSTALTSGCFEQETSGYTIGACACRTIAGASPCNSSMMNVASFLTQSILVLMIIFYSGNILIR